MMDTLAVWFGVLRDLRELSARAFRGGQRPAALPLWAHGLLLRGDEWSRRLDALVVDVLKWSRVWSKVLKPGLNTHG